AQGLRHAYRSCVLRPDHADDAGAAEYLARERECRGGAFARVAASPVCACERVGELETWEALGLMTADAPDERTRGFFLHRPQTIAEEHPMAQHHGHMSPRVYSRIRCPVAEVSCDFGVAHDGGVFLEVALDECAQEETVGGERWNRGHMLALRRSRYEKGV